VQRGGYSAPDFQKRKAEEVRHFFKEFATEVGEFDRRYRPDQYILLGTDENVKNFADFLALPIRDKVVHTGNAPVDESAPLVLDRLTPFLRQHRERTESSIVQSLRERVQRNHLAAAGFHDTLQQLQQGKLQSLVMGNNVERNGSRCQQCHFLLARAEPAGCPYCGGETRDGVDLVEAMIRIAAEQEVRLRFVPADALTDIGGVGGLLKY
jgi:peptide subunit release factor 1 (eRF1)